MTENDENKTVIREEEKTEEIDGGTTTVKRKSVMQVNPDGGTTISDTIISSTIKNEIKLDENTKVNVHEVEAEFESISYIKRFKSNDLYYTFGIC